MWPPAWSPPAVVADVNRGKTFRAIICDLVPARPRGQTVGHRACRDGKKTAEFPLAIQHERRYSIQVFIIQADPR
jgi:hypothetical protein